MNENKIKIDVCVATYKRPHLIEACLNSIIIQKVRDDVEFRIIVIDNDKACSAKDNVNKIQSNTNINIIYDTESNQNIAAARNKALTHVDADYFVCIDDDEQATAGWLMALLESIEKYDADVAFGPVDEVIPDSADQWLKEGGFFSRPKHESGALLTQGATNNTIVKTSIVEDQPFNLAYGVTGGSDAELFSKLYRQGYKLIWCNEALVREDVMPSRLNLKWLLMRSYRGGQTYIRVHSPHWSKPYLMYWYFLRVVYIFISVISTAVLYPFKKTAGVFFLRKLIANIGHLTGRSGFIYNEYKD
jgi:succinoglycan biosynthesis protein ExoM